MRRVLTLGLAVVLLLAGTACGSAERTDSANGTPRIVVTTNILGDIVRHVAGDQATVEVLMPLGADPHEFALSAKQADALSSADLVVVNGAGIEAGMQSVIDKATTVFSMADHVTLRDDDPHIWTDPLTIEPAVVPLGAAVAKLAGVAAAQVTEQARAYAASLTELDADVRQRLSDIPRDRRVLVTNHEVLGYFAARYDFAVLGAVIPSLNSDAQSSAKDLEALAATIKEHQVPAIFAETTTSTKLADALARAVGRSVKVVELYTESLGQPDSPAGTYVGMIQTNAELIATALAG